MTEFAMDYLTFGDNFGESFGNASNIESLSNIPNILFPPNPYFLANSFVREPANLNT